LHRTFRLITTGNKPAVDIAVALQKFDRARLADDLQKAEEERTQVIARFPLEDCPTMPLERYALGLGVKDSFSWWMEWGTEHLGSISGGSSQKHLIYRHRTKG
jgi:5-methylcytosine-specific restriction enzyme B